MVPEITLDMVRVTEAAALMSSLYLGRGDKEMVDQSAVDAMRGILDLIDVRGTIVIGEGEKDKAPMLYPGEKVGKWGDDDPAIQIAVDPVDGTRVVANGQPNALSIIAAAENGKVAPLPTHYVEKLAVGKELAGKLDINSSVKKNLLIASKILDIKLSELTITLLNRKRNDFLIEQIRSAGARIRFIEDGDVAGAISTALSESGTNIYMGIGGSPEAVLAAAALLCMEGEIQVKCWPRNKEEINKVKSAGFKLNSTYYTDDLISGDDVIFSATAITDGSFLRGIRYSHHQAMTDSIVMRSSTRTMRKITAYHDLKHKTITTKTGGEKIFIDRLKWV
ncbi:MAG: class II fructose-bisphosphatase [Kosmotogaceae bacterium]